MQIIDINNQPRECDEISIDPHYPGFVRALFISKTRKGYQHSEWYPIEEFKKLNPWYQASTVVKESLGIVSSASKSSLTDKTKDWETNSYVDYPIWISRGTGEGQIRKISSNTSDTVLIDSNWQVIPDETSQYLISYNVHSPKKMDNQLPV